MERLLAEKLPGVEPDQIDVYLAGNLDLYTTVTLFDAETIPNLLEFEINGTHYINLFPLYMLKEMVQEFDVSGDQLTSTEIAQRAIDYRIRDA